jgi:hypothetical protein
MKKLFAPLFLALTLVLCACVHHTATPPILNAPAVSNRTTDSAGIKSVNVHIVAQHADGSIFSDQSTHNLRTTGGADWQANAMGTTATQPAAANYVAVSNNATAPAAGDCAAGSTSCTLSGEITTNGCARAQATYSHTNGTNTFTFTHTFTATGAQSVQEAGLFNASSSGTMVFEDDFSQVTLANTDTLTITWTVSI